MFNRFSMKKCPDSLLESGASRSDHESMFDDVNSISSLYVMNSADSSSNIEPLIVGEKFLGFSTTVDVDSSPDSASCDINREVSTGNSVEEDSLTDYNQESSSIGGVDQLFLCPSFNSYTENIVESASRAASQPNSSHEFHDLDDSFEFSMLRSTPLSDEILTFPLFDHSSSIDAYRSPKSPYPSSDSIRSPNSSPPSINNPIRNPNSPIPATDSIRNSNSAHTATNNDLTPIRVTTNQLFYSNHNANPSPSSSSSSSESEGDLEELAKGPYCRWNPKTTPMAIKDSRNRCRKSKSTGSSCKRWILSGLLSRSCSDVSKNRTNLVVTHVTDSPKQEGRRCIETERSSGNNKNRGKVNASAHELMYVWNRAHREGEKRRSFLPYKPNLVGFFSTSSRIKLS